MRLLLTALLSLTLLTTGCGKDQCKPRQDEVQALIDSSIEKALAEDLAGSMMDRAKAEQIMYGEYEVCFWHITKQ